MRKQATKMIKTDVLSIDDVHVKYVPKKVICAVSIESHPIRKYFSHVRSVTRLIALPCKTQRHRKSLIPNSVRFFIKY